MIYIIDLEPIETRYTAQWKEHLPLQLINQVGSENVTIISGGDVPQTTTPGAFLNFGGTNVYKSRQLELIGTFFCNNKIKDGDYFLYTDAWNPTVIQLRYMAELLGIKIRIGGMWHAGSYDPQDFLGRLVGDIPWVRSAEHSMFSCYDHNFFATQFHIDMFAKEILNWNTESWSVRRPQDTNSTINRVGWPMEYLNSTLLPYKGREKSNLILFPHRIAPEKQLEIFLDLKDALPQYEFIVCQDRVISKKEYHELLGRAKVIFSANNQETLGISWYEGVTVNCIPMVPDRLSYSEMALSEFKYPSEWTETFDAYRRHRNEVVEKLDNYIKNYTSYIPDIARQFAKLDNDYFNGSEIYRLINQY